MTVTLVHEIKVELPWMLKDGQIAVIRGDDNCEGEIVQRYMDHLILLGGPHGKCWSEYFVEKERLREDGFRFEILSDGTELRVEDNQ